MNKNVIQSESKSKRVERLDIARMSKNIFRDVISKLKKKMRLELLRKFQKLRFQKKIHKYHLEEVLIK